MNKTFDKRSRIELEALMELILVAFVFVSLLYAENKFLSVQNIGTSKEAKRLALMGEALQTVPIDLTMNYKQLNYSMKMTSGNIELKSSASSSSKVFARHSDSFTYSCSVELLKKKEGSKDIYIKPYVVFKKSENEITCVNTVAFDDVTANNAVDNAQNIKHVVHGATE